MPPTWRSPAAISLGIAAGLIALELWRRKRLPANSSDNGETSEEAGAETDVDLHGRPWRAKGVGRNARAKHWAAQSSTANAWGSAEDEALAAELAIMVPRDPNSGKELPITAATLPQWLTVVMTTSPVTSNPSTALIEEVVASMQQVEHLDKCPKLVICDG